MRSRRSRLASIAVAALLTGVSGVVITSDPVGATVPTLKGPAAVFTAPLVPISFTGTDPISHEDKAITTTAESTGTCDATSDPPVLDGCGSVHLSVGDGGTLSYDASGVDPTSGSPSGQGDLQFAGTKAALNQALSTLVYTPPIGFDNLPSTPTYLTVNSIDGVSGDDTASGSPDSSLSIEIRVAPPNLLPVNTVPASPQDVAASSDTVLSSNAFSVSDPDLETGTPDDQRLLIMWTTCGTFDLDGGSFTVGPDIKTLLNNQVGLNSNVTNAIYAALPSAVKNLPTSTSETDVSAVIGVGSLTDINDALYSVTFHAPMSAGTCTLHQLVDDLGNNGLPASYVNLTQLPGEYPTGYELPAMGFAESSVDFVVTGGVPTVTINQGATQPDPTSVSPILFDVVFSEPVTGFDQTGVDLSGTAGASAATVTGSGADYTVSVTGMTQDGTVIATVPADVATGTVTPTETNAASTSTDNVVTYQLPAPPTTTTTTVPVTTTTTVPATTSTTTVPVTTSTTVPATTSTTMVPVTTSTTTVPVTTSTTEVPVTTSTTTAPATTSTTEAPATTSTTVAPATTSTTVAAASTTVPASSTTAAPATSSTTTGSSTSGSASSSSTSGSGGGVTSEGSGTTSGSDPAASAQTSDPDTSPVSTDTQSLPLTGIDVAKLVLAGVLLIELGLVTVIVARRTRRQ